MTAVLSRLAAAALLALALALAAFGVALPVLDWRRDAAAEIVELRAQIDRYRDRLARIEATAPEDVPEDALFGAGSATLAAARLQGALDDAIRAAGGTRRSIQMLDAEPLDGARRIAVAADAVLTVEGLRDLLHALDRARPFVFVSGLQVSQDRGSEPGAPGAALAARISVFGLTESAREP